MFQRSLAAALVALLCAGPAHAVLFFSEYVEGSNLNKGLEIFNSESTAVDLGSAGCEIRGYQNGSPTVNWTVTLTGSVPGQGVYVIAHPSASFTGDQTGDLQFNGDDAVELACTSGTIDVIGQIGFDPGSEWGTGDTSTQNNTLRRNTAVCLGDDNGSDPFDPSIEWSGFPQDDFSGLGSHTATCGPDVTPPTIVSVTPSTTGPTAQTSINFTVLFSEPVTDFDDLSDVTVNHSGTSDTGISFTANSGSSHTVTVSGIAGMGSLSLTVNAAAVIDGASNPNSDTLTSAAVTIDPNAMTTLPVGLLLSEVAVLPAGAEYIEIHNSSGDTLDLEDVYLTDATFANGNVFYYQIVQGAGGGGDFGDFHARFPAGATIAAGEYQTIALNGSSAFEAAYGISPTYELYEDGAADGIADMREAFAGSINGQGDLSEGVNNGEVTILYYWDGQSDLVADLDYVVWGDRVEAIDKSGVTIDGPDADSLVSAYLNDTPIAQQTVLDLSQHATGAAWQRVDLSEGDEIDSGGNGLDGADETSENLRLTWGEGVATPGQAAGGDVQPPGPNILINEVNAVAAASDEFIELFDGGVGGTNLSGLVLVLYADTLQSYAAVDLAGVSTDATGYALIGGGNPSPDLILPAALNDGAAAIALYIGSAADFPAGTAVQTDGVLDALVYDSGQADVAGLLALLEAGQAQVDENANNGAATESLQRCPNGSGGRRRTGTYLPTTPSPGLLNMNCPVGDYYANVDAGSPASLRLTLHETIDDHQWFPYTAGTTDSWDILELADEDPNDSGMILDVYQNASYPKAGGGNSNYNREHTWPRSIGLGATDAPLNSSATDAHNLRLSNIGYNSDRGNKPFADCDPGQSALCEERATLFNNGVGGGAGVYPGNSNWGTVSIDGNTGSWEVWSDRRGDVARSIFYMDIRYEGGNHGGTGQLEPNLELTNDRNQIQITSSGTAFMGLLDVLLSWHLQDPVDVKEMARNEVVFSFQGNRNPFVDHPEWVACLYQNACLGDDVIFVDGFEAALRRDQPTLH
ncbi:MAG: hypothetical protein Tsb002_32960 [Wenzhouxiangellaceae bacterium]